MRIGVPKEIKNHEYRVGLTPASVRELVTYGHTVLVEANAGLGIGMDDAAYIGAGARIVGTAEQVFAGSEMIVKVKEPQALERQRTCTWRPIPSRPKTCWLPARSASRTKP